MIIAVLKSHHNFEDKLKSILDDAKSRKDDHIVIMTSPKWHMEVFDIMLKHKSIKRIKIAGDTAFIIKEMRIELKPITYYI